MSTLGTFAEYADFNLINDLRRANEPGYAKKEDMGKISKAVNPTSGRYSGRQGKIKVLGSTSAVQKQAPRTMKVAKQSEKSKKAVANSLAEIAKKKRLKMRNLAVGGGLGLAGLGTLGAIAYNNRNSDRRSEMSFGSAFANFVAGTQLELLPSDSTKGENIAGKKRELTAAELADIKKRSKKGDKVMSAEDIKSTQERLKKYGGQRTVERNIDAGGDVYKGAKGMDYVTRTGALLGSPERNMIAAGKNSKNEFIKGASEVAEKVGRAGYKTGAIGARGVLNKVVGRTLTGKGVRLGAAGLGLSAIGGAMKRNRQENQ